MATILETIDIASISHGLGKWDSSDCREAACGTWYVSCVFSDLWRFLPAFPGLTCFMYGFRFVPGYFLAGRILAYLDTTWFLGPPSCFPNAYYVVVLAKEVQTIT